MGRNLTISCDLAGCTAQLRADTTAGSMLDWVQRTVTDTVRKNLVDGVRTFSAATDVWLCPEHANLGAELQSPTTHHEVVDFIKQEQTGKGTDQ